MTKRQAEVLAFIKGFIAEHGYSPSYREINEADVLQTMNYSHPAYSQASIDAQQRHSQINGQRRSYFCGAYWGYGFHEDGVNSALAVAKMFGKNLDSCTAASTKDKLAIAGSAL